MGGLRNRNDVWLVSYGFSGRAREYIGGPPCLTKGIGGHTGNNNILVKLALPILEILTEKYYFITETKFAWMRFGMHYSQKGSEKLRIAYPQVQFVRRS
jgi:hypothetical protein